MQAWAQPLKFVRMLATRVLLPTVLAAGLVEAACWQLGVTVPPSVGAAAQARNRDVIWMDDMQHWAALKLARIAQEQPDIILIGSSRCAEARSAMFKPYKTYNACLTAWSIDQMREFLGRVYAVASPKVVIMTADYFIFTDSFRDSWAKQAVMEYGFTLRGHFNKLIRFAEALKGKPGEAAHAAFETAMKRPAKAIDGLHLTGYNAIYGQTGYRYDGSLLFTPSTYTSARDNTQNVKHGLLASVTGASAISQAQMVAMKRLADFVTKHGSTLVGIQLPIYKSAIDILDTSKEYWSYSGIWREFEGPETKLRLAAMGVHFFDLARDPVSQDARRFIDSAHVSELGIIEALLHLTESDPDFLKVLPALDVKALREAYIKADAKGESFNVYRNAF